MASASVNQFLSFIFGLIALGLGIASIVIPKWAQVGDVITGVVNQCTNTSSGNETCNPIGGKTMYKIILIEKKIIRP